MDRGSIFDVFVGHLYCQLDPMRKGRVVFKVIIFSSFFVVWIVRFLQLVFFPIAYPMAWLLDKVLGEELGNIYSHHQLKGLIELHSHKRYLFFTLVLFRK
jgi:hypothetical protein